MEHKTVAFELKELETTGEIEGYAAVFGNVDRGNDIIMPKAFDSYLRKMEQSGSRPKMLWQHDPHQPIGVWDSLRVDDRGLFMKGRILPEVTKGREALALLKAKAMDGLSIGYATNKAEYKDTKEGTVRHLLDIDLWETSVVTFPMNGEATVLDVKQLQSPREVERLLRKAGVPGTFAKLVALYGFEGATNRLNSDLEDEDETKAREAKQYASLQQKLHGLKEILNA